MPSSSKLRKKKLPRGKVIQDQRRARRKNKGLEVTLVVSYVVDVEIH